MASLSSPALIEGLYQAGLLSQLLPYLMDQESITSDSLEPFGEMWRTLIGETLIYCLAASPNSTLQHLTKKGVLTAFPTLVHDTNLLIQRFAMVMLGTAVGLCTPRSNAVVGGSDGRRRSLTLKTARGGAGRPQATVPSSLSSASSAWTTPRPVPPPGGPSSATTEPPFMSPPELVTTLIDTGSLLGLTYMLHHQDIKVRE